MSFLEGESKIHKKEWLRLKPVIRCNMRGPMRSHIQWNGIKNQNNELKYFFKVKNIKANWGWGGGIRCRHKSYV